MQRSDIIYETALCSRVRWRHSKCDLCREGCALGALQLSPQLLLDEDQCTNCGICISRCPNGVFWSQRLGDSVIAQEIARLSSDKGIRTVVFSCSRSGQSDDNSIFLPCLGRLTENLLLVPFAFGANRVEIRWPECNGCTYEKCLSHLELVLFFGSKLTAMIGKEDGCILVTKVGKYLGPLSLPDRLSRRDLFHKFRVEATQTVAAFFPEFGNSHQKETWAQFVGAKRAYLLKLLRTFPRHTATCVTTENMPLASIAINSSCVGCPVCSTLCPTGALERIEKSDGVDIYFRPDICVGCKICQEACLFQAISILPTYELQSLVTGKRQHLAHLKRKNCTKCATDFLGFEEEICPTCRHEQGDVALSLTRRG